MSNNINIRVNAIGNFSQLESEIAKLHKTISLIQSKPLLGTSGDEAIANIKKVQNRFDQMVGATRAFNVEMVKSADHIDQLGTNLERGKLKLHDYYQLWSQRNKGAATEISQLVDQQARLSKSFFIPDALKSGWSKAITNLTSDLKVLGAEQDAVMIRAKVMNSVVRGLGTEMINLGKNTQWTGRQLTVGLTVPLASFAAMAAKQFREVNAELTKMQRLYGTGIIAPSHQEIDRVSRQVMELSTTVAKNMGIAQSETVKAAAAFSAVGVMGDKLIGATEQAMRLSKLGAVNAETAQRTIVSLQTVFKVGSADLKEAVDFLNNIQKQTSTDIQDLTDAIPRVGPIIDQLGGSYKDAAVMMVAMKEAGIPAAQSANAIKSAVASMIGPTRQAREEFQKYGISLTSITESSGGNPIKMIESLQQALQKLDPLKQAQLVEKLFGKFQFARVTALIDNLGRAGSQTQNAFMVANASAKQLGALADQEMKLATESVSARYERAMQGFKASLIPIGEAATKVATMFLNAFTKVSEFFDKLGPLKNIISGALGGAAIVGPILMLTGLMGNLIGSMIKGFNTFKMFKEGFSSGGGLMGGLQGIQNYFEKIDLSSLAASNNTDKLGNNAEMARAAFATLNREVQLLESRLKDIAVNSSRRIMPTSFANMTQEELTRLSLYEASRKQQGGERPHYTSKAEALKQYYDNPGKNPELQKMEAFYIAQSGDRKGREQFRRYFEEGQMAQYTMVPEGSAAGLLQRRYGQTPVIHGGKSGQTKDEVFARETDRLIGIHDEIISGKIAGEERAAEELRRILGDTSAKGKTLEAGQITALQKIVAQVTFSEQQVSQNVVENLTKQKAVLLGSEQSIVDLNKELARIMTTGDAEARPARVAAAWQVFSESLSKQAIAEIQRFQAAVSAEMMSASNPGDMLMIARNREAELSRLAVTAGGAKRLAMGPGETMGAQRIKSSIVGYGPEITTRLGFQSGGSSWVPGYGTGDKVPAMLEPGEFVVNRNAAKQYGGMLEDINFNKAPRFQNGGGIPGYQGGSWVQSLRDVMLSMSGARKTNVPSGGPSTRSIMEFADGLLSYKKLERRRDPIWTKLSNMGITDPRNDGDILAHIIPSAFKRRFNGQWDVSGSELSNLAPGAKGSIKSGNSYNPLAGFMVGLPQPTNTRLATSGASFGEILPRMSGIEEHISLLNLLVSKGMSIGDARHFVGTKFIPELQSRLVRLSEVSRLGGKINDKIFGDAYYAAGIKSLRAIDLGGPGFQIGGWIEKIQAVADEYGSTGKFYSGKFKYALMPMSEFEGLSRAEQQQYIDHISNLSHGKGKFNLPGLGIGSDLQRLLMGVVPSTRPTGVSSSYVRGVPRVSGINPYTGELEYLPQGISSWTGLPEGQYGPRPWRDYTATLPSIKGRKDLMAPLLFSSSRKAENWTRADEQNPLNVAPGESWRRAGIGERVNDPMQSALQSWVGGSMGAFRNPIKNNFITKLKNLLGLMGPLSGQDLVRATWARYGQRNVNGVLSPIGSQFGPGQERALVDMIKSGNFLGLSGMPLDILGLTSWADSSTLKDKYNGKTLYGRLQGFLSSSGWGSDKDIRRKLRGESLSHSEVPLLLRLLTAGKTQGVGISNLVKDPRYMGSSLGLEMMLTQENILKNPKTAIDSVSSDLRTKLLQLNLIERQKGGGIPGYAFGGSTLERMAYKPVNMISQIRNYLKMQKLLRKGMYHGSYSGIEELPKGGGKLLFDNPGGADVAFGGMQLFGSSNYKEASSYAIDPYTESDTEYSEVYRMLGIPFGKYIDYGKVNSRDKNYLKNIKRQNYDLWKYLTAPEQQDPTKNTQGNTADAFSKLGIKGFFSKNPQLSGRIPEEEANAMWAVFTSPKGISMTESPDKGSKLSVFNLLKSLMSQRSGNKETKEWFESRGTKFARGGTPWVPGSGDGDRVPAMLEPGEFVVNKNAAKQYGGLLNHLNWNAAPRFAEGSGKRRVDPSITLSDVKTTISNFSGLFPSAIARQFAQEMHTGLAPVFSGLKVIPAQISKSVKDSTDKISSGTSEAFKKVSTAADQLKSDMKQAGKEARSAFLTGRQNPSYAGAAPASMSGREKLAYNAGALTRKDGWSTMFSSFKNVIGGAIDPESGKRTGKLAGAGRMMSSNPMLGIGMQMVAPMLAEPLKKLAGNNQIAQGAVGMGQAGMQIGSMFGPYGALIGAGVGAIGGAMKNWFDQQKRKAQDTAAGISSSTRLSGTALDALGIKLKGFGTATVLSISKVETAAQKMQKSVDAVANALKSAADTETVNAIKNLADAFKDKDIAKASGLMQNLYRTTLATTGSTEKANLAVQGYLKAAGANETDTGAVLGTLPKKEKSETLLSNIIKSGKGTGTDIGQLLSQVTQGSEGIEAFSSQLKNLSSSKISIESLDTFKSFNDTVRATNPTLATANSRLWSTGASMKNIVSINSLMTNGLKMTSLQMVTLSQNTSVLNGLMDVYAKKEQLASSVSKLAEQAKKDYAAKQERRKAAIEKDIKTQQSLIISDEKLIKSYNKKIKAEDLLVYGYNEKIKGYQKESSQIDKSINKIQKEVDARQKLYDKNQQAVQQQQTLADLRSEITKAAGSGDILAQASAQNKYNQEIEKQNVLRAKESKDSKDQARIDNLKNKQENLNLKIEKTQTLIEGCEKKQRNYNLTIEKTQEKIETANEKIVTSQKELDGMTTAATKFEKAIDSAGTKIAAFLSDPKNKGKGLQDIVDFINDPKTGLAGAISQTTAGIGGWAKKVGDVYKSPEFKNFRDMLANVGKESFGANMFKQQFYMGYYQSNPEATRTEARDAYRKAAIAALGVTSVDRKKPKEGQSVKEGGKEYKYLDGQWKVWGPAGEYVAAGTSLVEAYDWVSTTHTPKDKDGVPYLRAQGGYIRGPGDSTSDSIPARLSNGEYVVKASSVAKYGSSFLDGINEQKFATGGFVKTDTNDIKDQIDRNRKIKEKRDAERKKQEELDKLYELGNIRDATREFYLLKWNQMGKRGSDTRLRSREWRWNDATIWNPQNAQAVHNFRTGLVGASLSDLAYWNQYRSVNKGFSSMLKFAQGMLHFDNEYGINDSKFLKSFPNSWANNKRDWMSYDPDAYGSKFTQKYGKNFGKKIKDKSWDWNFSSPLNFSDITNYLKTHKLDDGIKDKVKGLGFKNGGPVGFKNGGPVNEKSDLEKLREYLNNNKNFYGKKGSYKINKMDRLFFKLFDKLSNTEKNLWSYKTNINLKDPTLINWLVRAGQGDYLDKPVFDFIDMLNKKVTNPLMIANGKKSGSGPKYSTDNNMTRAGRMYKEFVDLGEATMVSRGGNAYTVPGGEIYLGPEEYSRSPGTILHETGHGLNMKLGKDSNNILKSKNSYALAAGVFLNKKKNGSDWKSLLKEYGNHTINGGNTIFAGFRKLPIEETRAQIWQGALAKFMGINPSYSNRITAKNKKSLDLPGSLWYPYQTDIMGVDMHPNSTQGSEASSMGYSRPLDWLRFLGINIPKSLANTKQGSIPLDTKIWTKDKSLSSDYDVEFKYKGINNATYDVQRSNSLEPNAMAAPAILQSIFKNVLNHARGTDKNMKYNKKSGYIPTGWIKNIGLDIQAPGKNRTKPSYFADGGYISGNGTATSDSIPARLSNGEYVIKASAVSKYGVSMMDALNNGSLNRKFATGGLVTSYSVNSDNKYGQSPFNDNSVYNINVSVDTNASPDDIANAVMTKIQRQQASMTTGRTMGGVTR